MNRWKKVLYDTLKKCSGAIFIYCLSFILCTVIFYLYRLSLEPFLYTFLLIFCIAIVLFIILYIKELQRAIKRENMFFKSPYDKLDLSSASLLEKDYQKLVYILQDKLTDLKTNYDILRQEDIDYYTAWVHQIKTPIAVMRMELGTTDTELSRTLKTELFKIEQYVDMVLQYIRIDSDTNDLVIKEYPLDELIRETIHKFAPQFIARKLGLNYDGTDFIITTDKKWFICILEQCISNAIKYTPKGTITIREENGVLSITDTGIGIVAEDIPRIFEKGYTGINGRIDKRSSGLGLYLCKKISKLLHISLSASSTVGKGSTFSLDLREHRTYIRF